LPPLVPDLSIRTPLLRFEPIEMFYLPLILVPHVKLEFRRFFDYFRLKCCVNWENKKNNITGRSACCKQTFTFEYL